MTIPFWYPSLNSPLRAGMVVKHIIALMGAVAESLTVAAMLQLSHGKRNFAKHVQYLCEEEFLFWAPRHGLQHVCFNQPRALTPWDRNAPRDEFRKLWAHTQSHLSPFPLI